MPRLISEITSGTQFSRSQDEGAVAADAQNRAFRVLLSQPGEVFNVQQACGVFIGDQHPHNTNIYCRSFSAQYEGESRMSILCTFQYQSTAGSDTQNDPGQYSPDVRPANWSVSTSLMEAPVGRWKKFGENNWEEPHNPAGDIYDGVTKMVPITTITIEQWEPFDPTRHCRYAGYVNDPPFQVGSLYCDLRTVMFRGVSCRPAMESWGNAVYRGWTATYEFLYRPNWVNGRGQVGWDLLVPQSGLNCLAFPPGEADSRDPYAQPLKHRGKIVDPLELPDNVLPLDKVRCMVRVHEYETGGASQLPCGMPIPLNNDGRPRSHKADPKVIVNRYQVQDSINFLTTFMLRLT